MATKPAREHSPHRHCTCRDLVVDAIVAAFDKILPDGHTGLAEIQRLKGRVMPGCAGTPLPPVQWSAVQTAVQKLIAKKLNELQDQVPDSVISADTWEVLDRVMRDHRFTGELAEKITGSIEQIIKITLTGQLPPGARRQVH